MLTVRTCLSLLSSAPLWSCKTEADNRWARSSEISKIDFDYFRSIVVKLQSRISCRTHICCCASVLPCSDLHGSATRKGSQVATAATEPQQHWKAMIILGSFQLRPCVPQSQSYTPDLWMDANLPFAARSAWQPGLALLLLTRPFCADSSALQPCGHGLRSVLCRLGPLCCRGCTGAE